MTTGLTRKAGSFLLVKVDFGPNEKAFKPYDLLEPVEVEEDVFALLGAGRFGGLADLRRVLTFEKVKGDLTNVFYSMEASNTDFYPHQFKAVLKFIESPVGRLLIADEVGLGKTIESIYIWKELQARQDVRRLLVVCPAMLREKWRRDLQKRFNIAGEIVTATRLLEKVTDFVERGLNGTFVDIVSLESLRPPADFENDEVMSTPARFARLLDQHVANDDSAIFDLVIVDEAHYLRNPATASNRLGRLLRESSHHMVLLTATPIHVHSNNLYELLRMIDPDEFFSSSLFGEMLQANAPIIRALRALWRQPPHVGDASEAIRAALSSPYFANDAVLNRIDNQVGAVALDLARRVELVRLLETRSLLGQYMTRSRKREVLENKVERSAQVLKVKFSPIEREIYDRVTDRIRNLSVGQGNASLFSLIARQRQMASSLVAALKHWQEKGVLEELLDEDLGPLCFLDQDPIDPVDVNDMSPEDILENLPIELEELERLDGKYNELREFLGRELDRNPKEKFVVFAFFRGTLRYLHRRLRCDGLRTALIMGGMGDGKDAVLDQFRAEDGPPVLLSSEVGSEGIDLQFCRFVVNYDLPWNPMRVEQRIGRLDRLGQKAERISIINLALPDTIEDRIVLRLYERIALFQQSIGDLEDILGATTERLMLDLLDPELNDEERERRAEAAGTAIVNRQAEQDILEQQAVNLVGFSDYILDNIRESRDEGHWLSAGELMALVEDFFAGKYPGTKLEDHGKIESALRIRLSQDAQADLDRFMVRTKPVTHTRLHQSNTPVLCLFDPHTTETFRHGVELIEPTHPLVRWIREDYGKDHRQLHPVSAVKLDTAKSPGEVGPGDYAFVTHKWSLAGLRSDHILVHSAIPLGNATPLDASTAERLIVAAETHGRAFVNAANVLGDLQAIRSSAEECDKALGCAFEERLKDFEAENEHRCNQQETSARKFSDRRTAELKERIERFRAQGKSRLIPMTEGLLRREERQLEEKLDRVAQRRSVDPSLVPLAAGVIRVE